MARGVKNKVYARFKKDKYQRLLGIETNVSFHKRLCENQGLDLGYKTFMRLVSEERGISWFLVYAMAIANELGVSVEYLFEIVEVEDNNK